ncbi:MAG: hypothetical protein JO097_01835 [Acidobacteriaceae bacterium]|nr:hypothetical protein [Acidobacteriaceae bacterium]MBV9766609.1 hypothetical protein [Acidobacteriaceae bacterium]
MASRLNLLFETAPKQFLEKTVLFTDELTSPESTALMRNRIAHCIDLQPLKGRATAQVLSGVHLYSDTPLTSYFTPPGGSALIPKDDPPYRFVFFPEFSRSRLLVRREGDGWLRLQCEEGLAGSMPAPESQPDSPYLDSFAYWDYTTGHLVGRVRATAVLVKEPNQPWTIFMQQIVGTPGFEVVRSLFSRSLRY